MKNDTKVDGEIIDSSCLFEKGENARNYCIKRGSGYLNTHEISIRFHDTETNDVVWYAFTIFKRASDKFDQAGVDSLIQEVLTSFN